MLHDAVGVNVLDNGVDETEAERAGPLRRQTGGGDAGDTGDGVCLAGTPGEVLGEGI